MGEGWDGKYYIGKRFFVGGRRGFREGGFLRSVEGCFFSRDFVFLLGWSYRGDEGFFLLFLSFDLRCMVFVFGRW